MNRISSFGLGIITFGMFSYGVLGNDINPHTYNCTYSTGCTEVVRSPPRLPDPTLTPGAILDTDPTVVCAPGYDKSHRVWRSKHSTAAKYGIPWSDAQGMEDDDLVPVGLGGNNADPWNHWLQPLDQATTKDVQERRDEAFVCRVLRDQGSIAATKVLHEKQQYYLTNGWAK